MNGLNKGVFKLLKTEKDILSIIQSDEWMMRILKTVQSLHLPDWWVCAGFVRSKIWDVLHGFTERSKLADVDVVYFDPTNTDEQVEKELEEILKSEQPDIPWSVKNQARMHVINNIPPYTSSVDAISKFPETVTALGIRLEENGQLILTAPCGIEDVIHLEVKPTPYFKETEELRQIYKHRVRTKKWESRWTKVKINYS
jgi:uncharacterized protein